MQGASAHHPSAVAIGSFDEIGPFTRPLSASEGLLDVIGCQSSSLALEAFSAGLRRRRLVCLEGLVAVARSPEFQRLRRPFACSKNLLATWSVPPKDRRSTGPWAGRCRPVRLFSCAPVVPLDESEDAYLESEAGKK